MLSAKTIYGNNKPIFHEAVSGKNFNNNNSLEVDKPQSLDQDEWKYLLHLEEQIKRIRQMTSDQENKERDLVKLELQAIELRDILRYKLTIIDNFLLDPTILDKIEKEDLFALGNLNNLKTLAKVIDKSRTA